MGEVVDPMWHRIKGIPMVKSFLSEEEINEFLEYNPKESDIFLITYPKCGTTWAQYIIWEIMNKGAPPPKMHDLLYKYFPFIDAIGTKVLRTLENPRTFKTHLPLQFIPFNSSAKYIFVLRNPWDCCISFSYHVKELAGNEIDFEQYFEWFLDGELPYGSYFDHVSSYLKHKGKPNVLFLLFEEMKNNPRENVLKIASFLGGTYKTELEGNEEIMENILKHTNFNYLKENIEVRFFDKRPNDRSEFLKIVNEPLSEMRKFNFFRKGEIGDHKTYLSKEQKSRLQNHLLTKIVDEDLVKYWIDLFP